MPFGGHKPEGNELWLSEDNPSPWPAVSRRMGIWPRDGQCCVVELAGVYGRASPTSIRHGDAERFLPPPSPTFVAMLSCEHGVLVAAAGFLQPQWEGRWISETDIWSGFVGSQEKLWIGYFPIPSPDPLCAQEAGPTRPVSSLPSQWHRVSGKCEKRSERDRNIGMFLPLPPFSRLPYLEWQHPILPEHICWGPPLLLGSGNMTSFSLLLDLEIPTAPGLYYQWPSEFLWPWSCLLKQFFISSPHNWLSLNLLLYIIKYIYAL